MKFIVLCCVIFSLIFVSNGQNSKLDNFDIDVLLKNDRILNNYLKCLLDKGPCTNEGRELKKTLPEVLKTNCGSCSPKQRKSTKKLIDHLENKKPQQFKLISARYDPSGEYLKNFKTLN